MIPDLDDPRIRGLEEIARGIADGSLTAEAVFRDGLDLIAERDPAVRAWVCTNDAGLAEARRIDAGTAPRGALTGMPIAVKDVMDTRDLPTAYGSGIYRGNRPVVDAAAVAQARKQGALVMGKTVTTEFAFVSPGPTCNPSNPAHTPGGSSSGSAAAVAAGMVPAAFGTQTSGSVIRPASFCGVVGCKPSFGLIDRTGTKTLAQSLDTIGLFTRSVPDLALLLAAVSGRSALAGAARAVPAPKIGLFLPPEVDVAEEQALQILSRAARLAAAAGATVSDVSPTELSRRHLEFHEGIMDAEVISALAGERMSEAELLAPMTRQWLGELEARASGALYEAGLEGMRAAQAGFEALIGDNDVLLTLSAAGEAPEGLRSTGDPTFNRGWTTLHVPCITVPAGRGAKGLPIGVQVVAREQDDATALRVAAFVERALGDTRNETV